jgi:hypothetical protein
MVKFFLSWNVRVENEILFVKLCPEDKAGFHVCIEHELNSFWRCPDNAYPVKAFDAQDFDVFPPRNVHVSARLERNYLAMKS